MWMCLETNVQIFGISFLFVLCCFVCLCVVPTKKTYFHIFGLIRLAWIQNMQNSFVYNQSFCVVFYWNFCYFDKKTNKKPKVFHCFIGCKENEDMEYTWFCMHGHITNFMQLMSKHCKVSTSSLSTAKYVFFLVCVCFFWNYAKMLKNAKKTKVKKNKNTKRCWLWDMQFGWNRSFLGRKVGICTVVT